MEDILITGPHEMEALFRKVDRHELSIYLSWQTFALPSNSKQVCSRGRKATQITLIRVNRVLESGAVLSFGSRLFKKVQDRMEKRLPTCDRPDCECEKKQLAAIMPMSVMT